MKKRSVLYTWIVEFSILLFLMAAMCVTLTLSARKKLLDEYTEITIQQQEKIETALNASLAELKTDAINLACNSSIRSFSLLPTPSPADNYTLYTIQSLLTAPGNDRSEVTETYIYFRNIQKALTGKTVYEKRSIAAALFGPGEDAEQRFAALRMHSSLFRIISSSAGETTQILTVTSIPTHGRSPTALIIQVLNQQALRSIVAGQAAFDGTTTLLTDEEGQLLCGSGNLALAEQLAQMSGEKTKKGPVQLDGKRYYLVQKQLAEAPWNLITLVPLSTITRKSDWVWRQSALFLLGFLVVGVTMAALMVRLNYQPLQELTRSLPQKPEAKAGQNEYQRIDDAFQTYRSDLERMQMFQESQRVSLQKELVQNLLEHDIDILAFSQELVSWVRIDSWGEWFVLLLKDEGLDFAEPLMEDATVLSVQPHGVPTLCLFAEEEATLRQNLALVETFLKENGVAYLAGDVCCGWKQIHPAFLSLCERSELAQEQPERSPVPTANIAQRIAVIQSAEIARLTFSGEAQEAIRALHHTLQTNFGGAPDMFLLRMLFTDVLVALYNAVPVGDPGKEVQQAIVATSRTLQRAMTHTEAEEQMDTLIGAVAAKYASPAETDQPELLSRILQCVQEHFCEHDFNVSRAADLLGLSVAYLSKYFKRQTGVNLLNYLNSLRIDYAKKLMDEEQITVAEAADRAGYENANTFIRLFKKYAGDTPGNYNKL